MLLPQKTASPNPWGSGEAFHSSSGGVADKVRVCAGLALL